MHGVFTARARLRAAIVPGPPEPPAREQECGAVSRDATAPARNGRIAWAMLAHALDDDTLACPRCGSRMKPVAIVRNPHAPRKILEHLRLDTDPPAAHPARAPPGEESS